MVLIHCPTSIAFHQRTTGFPGSCRVSSQENGPKEGCYLEEGTKKWFKLLWASASMYTLSFSKIRCLNMNNGMVIEDRCYHLVSSPLSLHAQSSLSTSPRFHFLSSPSSHPPAIHSVVYIASLASLNGCILEYTSCQRRQMHFGVPSLAVCANVVA